LFISFISISNSIFLLDVFEKNITLKDYVYGSLLIDPEVSFLSDLYESENFYFAGFFEKNTAVLGII
jgi:hypothetical protein